MLRIVPSRHQAGHGLAQFQQLTPLQEAPIHGGGQVAHFQRRLLRRIDKNLVSPGQYGIIHFPGPPGSGAGPDNCCPRFQVFPGQHRLHRGGDTDDNIAAGGSGRAAVHRLHRQAQGIGHCRGKGFPPFRSAAVGADFLDVPHLAHRFQLGRGLVAGTDNAHGGGLGIRQMLDRQAGGSPGSQLPQAVGLGVAEQRAAGGVIDADLKGILALHHGIGLDPQDAGIKQAAAHHRQHPARGDDFPPGQVHRRPLPELPLHLLNGGQHIVHGNGLVHFLVPEKQGHRCIPLSALNWANS